MTRRRLVTGPGGHFCENVGRNHRSNYIFFVINFSDGVFCQKCHDPECRDFRSVGHILHTISMCC